MTAISKSNSSFAKSMESRTKRLTPKKHLQFDAPLSQRKIQKSSACTPDNRNTDVNLLTVASASSLSSSPAFSQRFHGEMRYEHADDQVNNRSSWRSLIGTIADHRMTNNNRIRKQWRIFAVILLSLIVCLVQVTVVNGHPDPVPTPVRVSHSYTKTVSNTIPTSTTSRSTTQLTSFLPSDAISSLSASVINYRNYNAFASNRSSSSGSRFGSSMYGFKAKNDTSAGGRSKAININNNNNANTPSSSRRSTFFKANYKDSSSPVTSIDRPFYTKLTSSDAVATPTYYKRTKSATTKKRKKSKNSSKSPSSFSKFSKTKGSKEHASSSSTSVEEIDNDEYAFMPQTTEKSYHPPKLSLEPFFNFLTSLATASREVIMSKEQHHQTNNQHQTELSSSTTGGSSKYSPSYETINQSMREGAKKSKKSKKGKSKKSKSKGHGKGSKKGNKGGGKRHRIKSIESLEDEEEFDLDQTSEGPIPIPLPDPIIDSAEEEKENEDSDDSPLLDGMESPGGLHILDVLRTPMIPDYESPPQAARAEPLVATDYPDTGSGNSNSAASSSHKNEKSNASSSSSVSSNPPSGRANLNKGQGYLPFDNNYEGTKNSSSSGSGMMKQKPAREKQRSERDPMDSFHHQQHTGGGDLTAQESITHVQVVPSPFGQNPDAGSGGGLAPSSYQFQQQQQLNPKSSSSSNNNNDLSYSSPQQVSHSPGYALSGNSAAEPTAFRQQHQTVTSNNGKNDFVSKYPTTFVYQPNSPPGPPPPPGLRPNMNPSPPPGIPLNNNAMIYGSTPLSSRPPFRMNKLRPNLHSYYDSSYHNYAGVGESQVASEMIGIRHPYGPPHFKPPPPRVMHRPFPLPSPPRFVNGYGNRPGFMGMPHRGTHYVGHTFNNAAPSLSSSREPITKPYDNPNTDYQQDLTGNGNNNENSSVGNQDISGADVAGSVSDSIDQYPVSEIDDNSVTAAENSETKKVGIMDSFDLFYKEYKILTWVAVFFCTSMALLTLLVYLYINNPPTEVVQARQLFPWTDLLKNPQITRFLSNLAESSGGNRKRKKDNPVNDDDYDEMGYLKPYGKGFGGKSGKQKRKETRSLLDRNKLFQRASKIKRLHEEIGGSNSNVATKLTERSDSTPANNNNK